MSSQDKQLAVRHALAMICAEHTRRVQLLFADFYKSNVSMQQYCKRSRELTQRLVDEVIAVKS